MAYAIAASTAGSAANANASSTIGPMPGTLRWIMNGMTLMPAPTIEQTPVAVSPARPISRARWGSDRSLTSVAAGGIAGILSGRLGHAARVATRCGSQERNRDVDDHDQHEAAQRAEGKGFHQPHRGHHARDTADRQSQC